MSEHDTPVLSRAQSCPLGKCTEEAKTLLPEQVRNDMLAMATLNRQTLSEFMRDMCIEKLYGSLHMFRMHHNHRNGNG